MLNGELGSCQLTNKLTVVHHLTGFARLIGMFLLLLHQRHPVHTSILSIYKKNL